MGLSEKRREEIRKLASPAGDEMTPEIADFLRTSSDREELDFFAENWPRDGTEEPIHELIKNPYVDAGTLLRVYWYSDPEFYYRSHRSAATLPTGFDRDVFATLERIELRITSGDYRTASVPFDPRPWVTMWDRRSEFARQIPDVLYQPITGQRGQDG